MPAVLAPEQKIRRAPSLVSANVNDDLVILSVDRGKYYGTQVVGTRGWAMLEQPMSVDDLSAELLQQFDVDRQTCEREVRAFVDQLLAEGLVELA